MINNGRPNPPQTMPVALALPLSCKCGFALFEQVVRYSLAVDRLSGQLGFAPVVIYVCDKCRTALDVAKRAEELRKPKLELAP